MKIGVVTPTLNAERYVERTLSSIWSSRSEAWEIDHVIVDGGSTDETLSIAARYPSRVITGKDSGMYEAINRGMDVVEGEIVGYINADDEIAPGAWESIVRTFATHAHTQWVCSRVEYIDGAGQVLARMKPVRMSLDSYTGIGWSCIPQQTVWARRTFFDRVGPFDISYRNCGDYDWYARALRLAQPMILSSTLGRFRWHEGNLSYDLAAMTNESDRVLERWGHKGLMTTLRGRLLSLRLNLRNPNWFIAKKTGRLKFSR